MVIARRSAVISSTLSWWNAVFQSHSLNILNFLIFSKREPLALGTGLALSVARGSRKLG